MKLAIAGSRGFDDYELLCKVLSKSNQTIDQIVSGGARGADKLGAKYARDNEIDLVEFIPDWDKHGKAAGYIRNADIVDACDCLLALWDGKSKGTMHSSGLAKKQGKKVVIFNYETGEVEKFNHEENENE